MTLEGLSPDGVHLVATQQDTRPRALLVAEIQTGEIVAAAHGVTSDQRPYWEDPRHVLVATTQQHKPSASYFLRIGVVGTIERATGPARNALFVLPAPRG